MSQPGIDFRVVLVDSTGTALGTVGNPIFTSVSGGAVSATDSAAWTAASSLFNPNGGVFNDSAAALSAGQQGTLRMTAQRGQHVNLRTTAGADMGLTNNGAAPAALTNVGVLPVLANAAAPSWTEGRLVTLSSDLAGSLRVAGTGTFTTAGNLTHNNAAPAATNLGVLPALANAASPTYTEADQVLLSTDLSGLLRVKAAGFQASGTAVASNPILMGLNGSGALVRYAVDAVAGFPTTGTGVAAVHHGVFDGTNFQKSLQVTQATANTGVGLPAAGPLLWDLVGTTNFVKQAGDGSGRAMVVGAGAATAAVTGNPLLFGVKDPSGNLQTAISAPTATGSAAHAGAGYVGIALNQGSGNSTPLINGAIESDAGAGTNNFAVIGKVYNGTNYDRVRSNVEVSLLTSSSRSSTQTSADIVTYNTGAITVIYDNTVGSTYSDTLTINGKDPVSGKYFLLLSSAAIATVTTNVYVVDPAVPAVANVSAQKRLPRTIQIVVTAGNANAHTYSVGYVLQPA